LKSKIQEQNRLDIPKPDQAGKTYGYKERGRKNNQKAKGQEIASGKTEGRVTLAKGFKRRKSMD